MTALTKDLIKLTAEAEKKANPETAEFRQKLHLDAAGQDGSMTPTVSASLRAFIMLFSSIRLLMQRAASRCGDTIRAGI